MEYLKVTLLVTVVLLPICSCESDMDPDLPGNPNPPANTTPDEASKFLVLSSASKITGSLPTPEDGKITTNIADAAFKLK